MNNLIHSICLDTIDDNKFSLSIELIPKTEMEVKFCDRLAEYQTSIYTNQLDQYQQTVRDNYRENDEESFSHTLAKLLISGTCTVGYDIVRSMPFVKNDGGYRKVFILESNPVTNACCDLLAELQLEMDFNKLSRVLDNLKQWQELSIG